MGIDIVLIQLAIVFLPGLIWAQIDARHAVKEKPGHVEFIIRVFLFGLFSYVVAFVGYNLFGKDFSSIGVDFPDQTGIVPNDFVDEVLISIGISIVLAVLWIYTTNYKILVRFLMLIKATRRYGDEDVWDFMFNSPQMDTEYVHVRDFDKGVTYTVLGEGFLGNGKASRTPASGCYPLSSRWWRAYQSAAAVSCAG